MVEGFSGACLPSSSFIQAVCADTSLGHSNTECGKATGCLDHSSFAFHRSTVDHHARADLMGHHRHCIVVLAWAVETVNDNGAAIKAASAMD